MSDFNDIIKEYERNNQNLQNEIEKSKRETVESMEKFSESLVTSVNEGVSEVYHKQIDLQNKVKELQLESKKFAKQTVKWLEMYQSFDGHLKEFGDVENWASTMENDLKEVANTLETIVRQREEKNARESL